MFYFQRFFVLLRKNSGDLTLEASRHHDFMTL